MATAAQSAGGSTWLGNNDNFSYSFPQDEYSHIGVMTLTRNSGVPENTILNSASLNYLPWAGFFILPKPGYHVSKSNFQPDFSSNFQNTTFDWPNQLSEWQEFTYVNWDNVREGGLGIGNVLWGPSTVPGENYTGNNELGVSSDFLSSTVGYDGISNAWSQNAHSYVGFEHVQWQGYNPNTGNWYYGELLESDSLNSNYNQTTLITYSTFSPEPSTDDLVSDLLLVDTNGGPWNLDSNQNFPSFFPYNIPHTVMQTYGVNNLNLCSSLWEGNAVMVVIPAMYKYNPYDENYNNIKLKLNGSAMFDDGSECVETNIDISIDG